MIRRRIFQACILALCLAGYVWLGYFTVRTDFNRLVLIYTLLFGIYVFICWRRGLRDDLKFVIGGALLLRLALIAMTPNLSDDYFRFVWDGLLVGGGQNPYLATPVDIIEGGRAIPGLSAGLYAQLNSPYYYSAYPPLAQFIFGLSAKLAGGSLLGNIIWLRVCILLADAGSIWLVHRIVRRFQWPPNLVALYALNPLIILELTGNLHFEAVMICFLLLAVYLLIKDRPIFSAVSFGLAVGAKLLPLIFLPLLLKRLGLKKSLIYYAVAGGTVLLLCAPFLNLAAISNYFSSLGLYFRAFEFNAGVYYIIKWLGLQASGDNVFGVLRILLPSFSLIAIITIAIKDKGKDWASLFPAMLFCLTAYLVFSASVHPWNLAPLVMLAAFTRYRYALAWSLLIVLAYAAYGTIPYSDRPGLVAAEYLLAGLWAAWELGLSRVARRLKNSAGGRDVSPA